MDKRPPIVVACNPDGSIETLLRDKEFDTSQLGHREIGRVSEVLFDDLQQKFYIRWLRWPFSGKIEGRHSTQAVPPEDACSVRGVLFFDTYEDAVTHEINRVNGMLKEGISFAIPA